MTDKLREQSIEFAKKHLFECAKEILEWGRTSILCDGKLRELAKKCEAWVRDKSYALGVAEAIVKDEALRAALAQQDAHHGCSSTSHVGLTDDEIVQLSLEWPAETNDWASHIDFARAVIEAYERKNGIK